MQRESIAGRDYFRVYGVSRRGDLHQTIVRAIEESGGKVLYASPANRAPFYFGVQTDRNERLGMLIYPATFLKRSTSGRAADENRGQLRFGMESSWNDDDHFVAFDVAGVDITMVLGVDPERRIFIGLDPRLWNPMPLGISFYAKDADLAQMGEAGWYTWEKDNASGKRRSARSDSGLEAVTAFASHRFLDYARFERASIDLGLDTALRIRAAEPFSEGLTDGTPTGVHLLEQQFDLTSLEILDIIGGRLRLEVAVRGGVAEHHLEKLLAADPSVSSYSRRDADGEPDFDVSLHDGRSFVVECKNVSTTPYADGTPRVETQKTRASKNDPASRFYKLTEFDVVAACLFSVSGRWEFKFAFSSNLKTHVKFPDRLAAIQGVDNSWSNSLNELPLAQHA